jgi:hypothetical protein
MDQAGDVGDRIGRRPLGLGLDDRCHDNRSVAASVAHPPAEHSPTELFVGDA